MTKYGDVGMVGNDLPFHTAEKPHFVIGFQCEEAFRDMNAATFKEVAPCFEVFCRLADDNG